MNAIYFGRPLDLLKCIVRVSVLCLFDCINENYNGKYILPHKNKRKLQIVTFILLSNNSIWRKANIHNASMRSKWYILTVLSPVYAYLGGITSYLVRCSHPSRTTQTRNINPNFFIKFLALRFYPNCRSVSLSIGTPSSTRVCVCVPSLTQISFIYCDLR